MQNALQIINRALLLLGAESISSLTPSGRPARLVTEFAGARDTILSLHPFRFARVSITPPQAVAPGITPPDGLPYCFALPSESLRLVSVTLYGRSIPYRTQSRYLFTSSPSPVLVFSRNLGEPNLSVLYPDDFATALSYRLAEISAFFITGSNELSAAMRDSFTESLAYARNADSTGSAEEDITLWTDYREFGTYLDIGARPLS